MTKRKQEERFQNSFNQNVLTQIIRPKERLWYEAWPVVCTVTVYMPSGTCCFTLANRFPFLSRLVTKKHQTLPITAVRTKAVFPDLQSNKGSKQINVNILGNSGGDTVTDPVPPKMFPFIPMRGED